MEAEGKTTYGEQAPARYRLNRRAALLLSGIFLILAGGAGSFCFYRLQPERRLASLRENLDHSLASGQNRRAAIELANLVRLTPNDVEAWLKLARVQLRILGETEAVAGESAPAIPLDAGRDRLRLAISAYRRVTELDPKNLEAQRWLLELSLRGGNWTDARCRLDAVQAIAASDSLVSLAWEMLPTEFLVEATLARKSLAARDYTATLERTKPLLSRRPADLEILDIHAQAATLAKMSDLRHRGIATARKIVPDSARIDLIESRCLWLAGDIAGAERLASKATRSPHVELAARQTRAEILKMWAQTDAAAAPVRFQQAALEYKTIVERSPADQPAANEAAWIIGENLGRWAEAFDITTAMLGRVERPEGFLLDTHGWILLRLGRRDEAVACFRRAAAMYPNDFEIQIHRSMAEALLLGGAGKNHDPASKPVWPLLTRSARPFERPEYFESLLPEVSPPAVATGDDGSGGVGIRLVRNKRGQP